MKSTDVVRIVNWLEQAGISVWLDGGWGVDALVGQQTRPHRDLDAVVWLDDVACIEQVLAKHGFAVTLSELPTRFVMEDAHHQSIDFHTVRLSAEGEIVQVLQDSTPFCYPSDSLTGQGVIKGHSVPCITPEAQMLCHTGYKPLAKDIHNVRLLREHFSLQLPSEYVGIVILGNAIKEEQ